jgi:two-component system NtrC family sensor kinase
VLAFSREARIYRPLVGWFRKSWKGRLAMKIGTKLTLYLSIIIVLVLSGFGYLDVLSSRDILIRKMKAEVRSAGRTLKVSLEEISPPEKKEYIQGLIDAMGEYERNLGVVVYYPRGNLVFHSPSLKGKIDPYLDLTRRSMREDAPQEKFGTYEKLPVFFYTFPLGDREGKTIGGVSILQETSSMEKEIEQTKWSIFIMISVLILGTVALVLLGTRKWITLPISNLMEGIKNFAGGNLDYRIEWKTADELSELAQAFNQMAVDLRKAQERIIRETETKLELERGLRESEKLAIIGQLASGLAHEIGTPINIIYGRTELIQKRLEDKEGLKKNLDIVLRQTERITKIIQQLLGFVRKKKPEQKVLNLPSLLEGALELLDHQIRKQKVRVVKDRMEGLPSIIGDSDQLQQVFLNLILNAIQSMPEGGILSLSAAAKMISKDGHPEDRRSYLEVSVQDNGAGMEKEVLQNIFTPFFTTKDTGTGLGLMVTQGIIQDHGGWMEVESEVGKGSRFSVYLPSLREGER